MFFFERAVEPRREKRRCDAIADRETFYAAADLDDVSGTVGCRHDSLCALLRSSGDHDVPIIQRHRAHPDTNVAGTDARRLAIDQLQRVETVLRMKVECFHDEMLPLMNLDTHLNRHVVTRRHPPAYAETRGRLAAAVCRARLCAGTRAAAPQHRAWRAAGRIGPRS